MSRFKRVPLHDLRNLSGENTKKICNCENCKEIRQRKNMIFGYFFRRLFTKKVLSKKEKEYLLKEFN